MQLPAFLSSNNVVSIVGLASKVRPGDIDYATSILESWGLHVKTGKHLFKDHFRFSGTDEEKIHDFQQALDDPTIKAIFTARGGYGSAKIVDRINWGGFVRHPKWIIGFSDITAVLQHIIKLGVPGIHCLMPSQFKMLEYKNSLENLKRILFGDKILIEVPPHPMNHPGKAKGQLVGGNLSIVCSLIGTPSDIDYSNKIVLIEEINEEIYRIDRMLNQLKRSGKLKEIRGLLVGHFTEIQDDPKDPFGLEIEELIIQYFKDHNVPVAFKMPMGHEPDNLPVIVGMEYELSVDENRSVLTF